MIIFVYGTLNKGFENHHFLDGAKFIGNATTKEKYPMVNIIKAYPYLINQKSKGKIIKGEAYQINKKILSRLDMLEGYPEHYDRDEITLMVEDRELQAITYFSRSQAPAFLMPKLHLGMHTPNYKHKQA